MRSPWQLTVPRGRTGHRAILTATGMDVQEQPAPVDAPDEFSPQPGNHWTEPARLERLIAGLLLAFAVAFNLVQLYPEVAVKVPSLNDGVLHLANLQRASDALASGQDPTDHWLGTIVMGYPLLHHYQHLPYLLPALMAAPAREAVSTADLMRWITYLLLSLFPLSIYFSMRWFGFSPLPSALAGLASPLLSTNGLYGLEYGSYVWRGYGLYTQLWGMVLLPMALARTYRAVKDGRGYFWAVVLLAATVLSHVVLGYIALGSAALFIVLGGWRKRAGDIPAARPWVRAARLVLLLALVGLVAAYFILPFLRDSTYMNRSVWERADKYDSLGYEWALGTLLKGELFDYGRLPCCRSWPRPGWRCACGAGAMNATARRSRWPPCGSRYISAGRPGASCWTCCLWGAICSSTA